MYGVHLDRINADQRDTIDPKKLCFSSAPTAQDTVREDPVGHELDSGYQVPSLNPETIARSSTFPASLDDTTPRYHARLGQTLSDTEWRELVYLERKASVSSESSTDPEHHSGGLIDTSRKCTWPGCTYAGTFRRQYERDRHMAAAHNTHDGFICPVPGCLKSQKKTFRRADKLISHLRTSHPRTLHHPNTIYRCAQDGCLVQLPGKLMFANLQRHLVSSPLRANPTARALLSALSPAFPRCPVSGCTANIALNQLPAHILRHRSPEISSIYRDLLNTNYFYALMGNDQDNSVHGRDTGFPVIRIVCPVCKCHFMEHQSLREHLVDAHVLRDLKHFQNWTSAVKKTVNSSYEWIGTPLKRDAAWKPWRLTLLGAGDINLDIRCPECNEIKMIEASGPIIHHLGMLDQSEHLFPYREAILDLYPEFATHPVFEDIYGCQSDIVQVFRLKRIGLRKAGNVVQDAISNNDVSASLPGLLDAMHPGHSIVAPCNVASLGDPHLMHLERFLERVDCAMLSGPWDQSCASSTSGIPYEGSEPDQMSDVLSCGMNPILLENECSTPRHDSDCNLLCATNSPQTVPSTSHQSSNMGKP